jgi:hypothetical protein
MHKLNEIDNCNINSVVYPVSGTDFLMVKHIINASASMIYYIDNSQELINGKFETALKLFCLSENYEITSIERHGTVMKFALAIHTENSYKQVCLFLYSGDAIETIREFAKTGLRIDLLILGNHYGCPNFSLTSRHQLSRIFSKYTCWAPYLFCSNNTQVGLKYRRISEWTSGWGMSNHTKALFKYIY